MTAATATATFTVIVATVSDYQSVCIGAVCASTAVAIVGVGVGVCGGTRTRSSECGCDRRHAAFRPDTCSRLQRNSRGARARGRALQRGGQLLLLVSALKPSHHGVR